MSWQAGWANTKPAKVNANELAGCLNLLSWPLRSPPWWIRSYSTRGGQGWIQWGIFARLRIKVGGFAGRCLPDFLLRTLLSISGRFTLYYTWLCVLPLVFLYVCFFHFLQSNSTLLSIHSSSSPNSPSTPLSFPPFLTPSFSLPPHVSPPPRHRLWDLEVSSQRANTRQNEKAYNSFSLSIPRADVDLYKQAETRCGGRIIRRISQRKCPTGGLEIRSCSSVIFKGRFGFTVWMSKVSE